MNPIQQSHRLHGRNSIYIFDQKMRQKKQKNTENKTGERVINYKEFRGELSEPLDSPTPNANSSLTLLRRKSKKTEFSVRSNSKRNQQKRLMQLGQLKMNGTAENHNASKQCSKNKN